MPKNFQQLTLPITTTDSDVAEKLIDGMTGPLIRFNNGHVYTTKEEALIDVASLSILAKTIEEMSKSLMERTGITPDDPTLQDTQFELFGRKLLTKVEETLTLEKLTNLPNKELELELPNSTQKKEVVFVDTNKILNDPKLLKQAEDKGLFKKKIIKTFTTQVEEE